MSGHRRLVALLAVPSLLAAVSCAPVDEAEVDTGAAETPTESAQPCAPENLPLKTPGQLTVGTDSPAYEPWFVDNDPSNGEG